MSVLIAILGIGKGTWAEVHALIETKQFEKSILFIDAWAAADYRNEHGAIVVPMPEHMTTDALAIIMSQAIKAHAHSELDVAVNISSGNGKQHAALIAAVLRSGAGIRLVTIENGELKVLF